MNYGRLVFAIAVAGLAACAPQKQNGLTKASASTSASAPKGAPVGSFREDVFMQTPVEKTYLTIDGDSVTATTVCKIEGIKVVSRATSPAQVSASAFNVLSSSEQIVKLGHYPCKASLKSGVTAYELKNNTELYVTPEGGESRFFGYMVGKEPTTGEKISKGLAKGDQLFNDAAVGTANVVKAIPSAYRAADQATTEFVHAIPGAYKAADQKTTEFVHAIPGAVANGLSYVGQQAKALDQKFDKVTDKTDAKIRKGFVKVDQVIEATPGAIKDTWNAADKGLHEGAAAVSAELSDKFEKGKAMTKNGAAAALKATGDVLYKGAVNVGEQNSAVNQ